MKKKKKMFLAHAVSLQESPKTQYTENIPTYNDQGLAPIQEGQASFPVNNLSAILLERKIKELNGRWRKIICVRIYLYLWVYVILCVLDCFRLEQHHVQLADLFYNVWCGAGQSGLLSFFTNGIKEHKSAKQNTSKTWLSV